MALSMSLQKDHRSSTVSFSDFSTRINEKNRIETSRHSLPVPHVNFHPTIDENDSSNRIKHIPSASALSITPRKSKISQRAINAVRRLSKFNEKRIFFMEQTVADLGHRLTIGKLLQRRLMIVSDTICFLAVFGIILMIIANELTFNRIDDGNTRNSWIIKLFITISTIILLVLLIYYHYLDLKLYSNQNSLSDDRIGLSYHRIGLITLELIICSIHPFPAVFPQGDTPELHLNSTITPYTLSHTVVDVGLSLPMFLRLYLFGRSILFHSRLVRNASLRSFSYLNRVSIDFFFLFKTYLEQWPGRCLLTFCISVCLISSWSLRACNYRSTTEHLSMSDGIWLFLVTFATVGYGDLYPSTYCGRLIATLIGLVGVLASALLITVLAQKLLLTRSQKYVHNFVLDAELAHKRYEHAANVVKFAVKVWYLRQHNENGNIAHLIAQRKLFHSISYLQRTKQQQKILTDNCIDLHELVTLQQNINIQYDQSGEKMTEMENNLEKINERLDLLTENLEIFQNSLKLLINQMKKTTHVERLSFF